MSGTTTKPLLNGFKPILNEHTQLLILGSFPGDASLQAQEYYAYAHNQFWRLIYQIFHDHDCGIEKISKQNSFLQLDYAHRLSFLLDKGIGLWDAYASCRRTGSLDSAITHSEMNDFQSVSEAYPNIKTLCFNGKTAGKIHVKLESLGFKTVQLPSSSPAYAQMKFEEKLVHWQSIKHTLNR